MSETTVKRKLTTILYADVAGYSRLTGSDEVGTHKRVMEMLDYASETIKQGDGTVLRYAGDAILAEFTSLIAAIETAAIVQRELSGRNEGLPDVEKIEVRIGINLGEVIQDRGEIYGDGVNLAARLESAAEPGGICISSSVYDHTAGKTDLVFTYGSEENFKNIDKPVHIYHWRPDITTVQSKPEPPRGTRPSIAVLAFTNMSGNPEQEFMADGISEDIITALSKVRWFTVIARNSTFTYKGQAVDIKQVGRDLDVRYVLEGSVRKARNRVRISAQLIETEHGNHVWAEKYDREIDDIFALQDEMTQTIAAAIEPELSAVERESAVSKPPENLDAWEIYHRGLWNMWTFEKDKMPVAIEMFERAIEIDPGFARAWAYLSYSRYLTVVIGWADDTDKWLADGMEAAKKARQYDDKDAAAHFAAGRIHMLLGEHDTSIGAIKKAIELNPSFAHAYHAQGFTWSLMGDLEEAKQAATKAMYLSPRDPALWAFTVCHALTYLLNEEYEEAEQWAHTTIQTGKPTGYWAHAMLAAACANLGKMDEAEAALKIALEAKPDLTLSYLKKALPTKYDGGLEPYLSGMRKTGLP